MSKNPQWYKNGTSKIPTKYNCLLCDYYCRNRKDFMKHCSTKKHGTKWYINGTSKIPNLENQQYFSCKICDYISCDLGSMDQHFLETGHEKKSLEEGTFLEGITDTTPIKELKEPEKIEKKNKEKNKKMYKCSKCQKNYKFSSGYYRHIKKCKESETLIENNEKLLKMLIETTESNTKLCQKIMGMDQKANIINTTIHNNNQKVNLNVYLNQECKNAMNLTDFVNSLHLSMDDLIYTKDNGFIKGITNIFVKNLEEIQPKDRPIHSIGYDNQEKQFYVKDRNEWQCDQKEEQINTTIDDVAKKQFLQIKEWENSNPEWDKTEKGMEDYMKMVQIIMGGNTELEREINRNAIKKEITEKVDISENSDNIIVKEVV
jgi:hypothetical protein